MPTIITLIGIVLVMLITCSILKLFEPTNIENKVYEKEEENIIVTEDNTNEEKLENKELEEPDEADDEKLQEKALTNLIMPPLLISKIMEENHLYMRNSYYDLNVEENVKEILDTQNILEDVSPQLICLKLIHNISMMKSFAINYAINTEATINNPLSKQKKLFLKLSIGVDSVDIIERRGFGLIGYNVDDMAYVLYCYYEAMEKYIKELSKDQNYSYLKRVLKEFDNKNLSNADINEAMILFLNNNKDFYKTQINEVKSMLKKEKN